MIHKGKLTLLYKSATFVIFTNLKFNLTNSNFTNVETLQSGWITPHIKR